MSTPVHWEVARARQDELRLAKVGRHRRRTTWQSRWNRTRAR